MNSVFSAFKSNNSGTNGVPAAGNSSSGSIAGSLNNNNNNNNNGHHTVGLIDGHPSKYAGKKITHDSSYENLRHIREIESCTTLSSFAIASATVNAVSAAAADDDDDDDNTTSSCSSNHTIRLGKRCVTPVVVSSAVIELAADEDLDDDLVGDSVDTVDFVASSSERPIEEAERSNGVTKAIDASATILCDSDTNYPKSCGSFDSVPPTQRSSAPVTKTIFSSEGDLLNSSCSLSTAVCAPPSECTVSALNISSSQSPALPPSSAAAAAAAAAASAASTHSSHAPIIVANSRGQSESNLSATKTTNRFQKRLTLSGFTNNSMPSVHGRPSSGCGTATGAESAAGAVTNGSGEPKRTRLSTHQRNLSLDFRSMGILLPPVSQVTNTRINLTQHHRNRSLDSALQRIPEVEVSSPSAESENPLCTTSILGAAMCSKITTTAITGSATTNNAPTPAVTTEQPPPTTKTAPSSGSLAAASATTAAAVVVPILSRAASVANGASSNGACTSRAAASKCIEPATLNNSSSNRAGAECESKKKREDLTSLGSDDSGIICGSEPDQASLNRIRRSHESIDSGEIDAEGEECIDLDTTSMDEDYRMLQSDLLFYQSSEDDTVREKHQTKPTADGDASASMANQSDVDKIRHRQRDQKLQTGNNTICVPINYEDDDEAESATTTTTTADETLTSGSETKTDGHRTASSTGADSDSTVAKPVAVVAEPPAHIKNEVIFKTIFGATKNAIYRTAQSIIENHEKKSLAKSNKAIEAAAAAESAAATAELRSPTEFAKKKDFFTLKPCSNRSKVAAASTVVAPIPETPTASTTSTGHTDAAVSPALPVRSTVAKSISAFSLGSLRGAHSGEKGRVPGIVKCIVRPPDPADQAASTGTNGTDKGSNGLLRFFESPVFNIHFALHYLFYSKEPGVLSFIGNKIFSFKDHDVDLYIPQLILMYMQMDELAEVLDPYLVYRCRRTVDFALKCSWLLEAYNFNASEVAAAGGSGSAVTAASMMMTTTTTTTTPGGRKSHLVLMRELYPRRERRDLRSAESFRLPGPPSMMSPVKKTHHRSQSDATGLLNVPAGGLRMYQTPVRLCLGDLSTGRAFDNGCTCFETVRGTVNGLRGHKTVCSCGAPKLTPQREFMKSLIDIGKNLTPLPTKTEKTSILRMRLNLINKNLPARVWLPLNSDIPHHVVRITEEKTAVLNSKDKTPYIIYVEVVEVADIYTSPVMHKLMPSLRHTKSEEHLESALSVAPTASTTTTSPATEGAAVDIPVEAAATTNCPTVLATSPASVTSSTTAAVAKHHGITDDDVWSQEDDEITAQYMKLHKIGAGDAVSQMSLDSIDSRGDQAPAQPRLFNIGDVRTRHSNNLCTENTRAFSHDPEDPSAAALKEPWHDKVRQIRESSPYGHLANWRLLSAIVKCGDDLRQELMATQLLETFKLIWQEESVDVWVRPYKIVCFSNDSGLIEPILNTVSLHQIKKNSNKSLRDYFVDEYGDPETDNFKAAQRNFMQSCAAYCLISYLLQVKDRHNGNILLHSDGHLIHIDFGFILSISPKNLGFEQSPFKLTPEFVDVMDGPESPLWIEFQHLLLKALMAARKHMDRVINLVEIMRSSAQLACFKNGCATTIRDLRYRFHMNLTEQELERKVEQLVQDSLNSLSTKLYDNYQYLTNGIL